MYYLIKYVLQSNLIDDLYKSIYKLYNDVILHTLFEDIYGPYDQEDLNAIKQMKLYRKRKVCYSDCYLKDHVYYKVKCIVLRINNRNILHYCKDCFYRDIGFVYEFDVPYKNEFRFFINCGCIL